MESGRRHCKWRDIQDGEVGRCSRLLSEMREALQRGQLSNLFVSHVAFVCTTVVRSGKWPRVVPMVNRWVE